jgi:DNA ligase 1
MPTWFADIVDASSRLSATSSRTAKRDIISALLISLDSDEVTAVVAMLSGEIRQGRIGVGWAAMYGAEMPSPLPAASSAPGLTELEQPQNALTVLAIDHAFDTIAATTGEGSVALRSAVIEDIFARSTPAEVAFLRALLTGGVRQGALDGVMADGVAAAAKVPAATVRRAAMLNGSLPMTARIALAEGEAALNSIGLQVLRGVQPMLAATSASVADAVAELGRCSVEWKLDGARIQVHRSGESVQVFTRNLNEVGHRLPDVVAAALALQCESVVLDGEALMVDSTGRPRPFQDTMSRFGQESDEQLAGKPDIRLRPFFFDIMHLDGRDHLETPLGERLRILEDLVSTQRIPGIITDDPVAAQAILDDAMERGHEGVMVKAVDSLYEAGRRGKAWRKVKPVKTLDLVVLAAEWGHGRRTGTLSNLHLGAVGPGGSFVMVGKTFKGLTDALLAWQTEEFLAREIRRTGITVWVRPELVVEIAVDGVQRSSRYPGGVALRFARVKGYRPDRDAATADTIETVQALLPGA